MIILGWTFVNIATTIMPLGMQINKHWQAMLSCLQFRTINPRTAVSSSAGGSPYNMISANMANITNDIMHESRCTRVNILCGGGLHTLTNW